MPANGHRSVDLLRRAACELRCREPVPHRGDLRGVRGLRLSSRHCRVAPPRPPREQQESSTAHARAWPVAEAAKTLRHDHGQRPRRADLPQLAADMAPDGPNQLWVADITYVAIATGFVYLAAILDAWSRRVVGYAISRSIDALHRSRLQCSPAALSPRLPQPRPLRGSTRPAPGQNRSMTLSTERGALHPLLSRWRQMPHRHCQCRTEFCLPATSTSAEKPQSFFIAASVPKASYRIVILDSAAAAPPRRKESSD